MAPIGTRVLTFLPPDGRQSFQAHAIDTWYIGPAIEHYILLQFSNQSQNIAPTAAPISCA